MLNNHKTYLLECVGEYPFSPIFLLFWLGLCPVFFYLFQSVGQGAHSSAQIENKVVKTLRFQLKLHQLF